MGLEPTTHTAIKTFKLLMCCKAHIAPVNHIDQHMFQLLARIYITDLLNCQTYIVLRCVACPVDFINLYHQSYCLDILWFAQSLH